MNFNQFPFRLFAVVILLLSGLSSCYVETAKSVKDKELAIVSDYLVEKDTVLFRRFKEKYKCRVYIRSMTTDQLIGYMRNADHNSGLDIVMMKSLQSVLSLNKNGVLHPLGKNERSFHVDSSYISKKFNYIGLGFDPFVISYTTDTIPLIDKYYSLSRTKHFNHLSQDDILVFLSPIRKEHGRVAFYSWTKKWLDQTIDLTSRDSLMPNYPILSLYSDFKQFPSELKSYKIMNYPKGMKEGSYFNLRTLAIIRQAEHFALARNFISFYRNAGYNEDLNIKLHTIPLFHSLINSNEDFVTYPLNPEKTLEYHLTIERMLDKMTD